MPRGYLKHKKEVGKKKDRGGSSGRRYIAEKDSDPARSRDALEDFVLTAATRNDANKKTPPNILLPTLLENAAYASKRLLYSACPANASGTRQHATSASTTSM